jgi:hypothetical protein
MLSSLQESHSSRNYWAEESGQVTGRGTFTMTTTYKIIKPSAVSVEALLGQNGDLFKRLLKESLQEVLEGEMSERGGAGVTKRTAQRSGYRSGY